MGARLGRRVEVVHAVVVRDDGDGRREVLLLVRPDVRGWEAPGGHCDPGETPEAAVAREVREETGLAVAVGACSGRYVREGFLPHRDGVYLCRPVGGALRPGGESARVAWWPADGLPATLLPWCREPLLDALRHRSGDAPVERTSANGLRLILEAARIDLRMRWSDDRAV